MHIKPLLVILFVLLLFQQNSFGQDVEANKAIARRYFEEAINQKKASLIDSIFDKDYHFHGLEDGSEGKGIDNLKNFLPTFFKAFPDIHYTISDIIAENDKVVVITRANGTHKDEIFGYKPTNGKLNNISEIFIFRINNNKIAEGWRQIDLYNLFKILKGES